MSSELEKLFLQEKPARMLLSVRKNKSPYVSIISRETRSTFAHTEKVLSIFKKNGLVRFQHEGRVKRIVLTRKGEQVAGAIEVFFSIMNEFDREAKVTKKVPKKKKAPKSNALVQTPRRF